MRACGIELGDAGRCRSVGQTGAVGRSVGRSGWRANGGESARRTHALIRKWQINSPLRKTHSLHVCTYTIWLFQLVSMCEMTVVGSMSKHAAAVRCTPRNVRLSHERFLLFRFLGLLAECSGNRLLSPILYYIRTRTRAFARPHAALMLVVCTLARLTNPSVRCLDRVRSPLLPSVAFRDSPLALAGDTLRRRPAVK